MNNPSLIIGTTLGFTLGVIVIGYGFYSEPKDSCAAVAQAYERAQSQAKYLDRGTSAGLSDSEILAIDVAGAVSEALGVSCFVTPGENQ